MKLLPFSIFAILFFYSCSHKKLPVNKSTNNDQVSSGTDYSLQGYTKAKVVDFSGLSGCKFLLILDDQSKLQPENLDSLFAKTENLVWIKYFVQQNAVSNCMAGKVVHLTDIIKR